MSIEWKGCGLEGENGKIGVESDYCDERAPGKREKHVSGIHSLIAPNSCARQRRRQRLHPTLAANLTRLTPQRPLIRRHLPDRLHAAPPRPQRPPRLPTLPPRSPPPPSPPRRLPLRPPAGHRVPPRRPTRVAPETGGARRRRRRTQAEDVGGAGEASGRLRRVHGVRRG